jgi:broad specificity phosphatase PhoE
MKEGSKLVVVRHGETEWSKAGRRTSRTDLPLTAEGEKMAAGVAARLSGFTFASVLVSPRLRARRTAELAGFGDRAETVEDLAEWDYGDDEGRTSAEIKSERPGWDMWRDGEPNGETENDVSARVDRVIERVLTSPGDVLAFAHGHLLNVMAARWAGLDGAYGKIFELDPATVSVLGWHHDYRVIERWNSLG